MIIVLVILLFIAFIAYAVIDHLNTMNILKESHAKIINKINEVLDGVKIFFTITMIDAISSAFDSKTDDEENDSEEV